MSDEILEEAALNDLMSELRAANEAFNARYPGSVSYTHLTLPTKA